MKFSALIAHYNNGKYFKDCYDSLINQTYQNWEAIIVDDCSTDDSLEVINELIKEDTRFKLHINETNKGCGFTKRKCVELATGEICGFIDPDDALYPEAIELSVNEYFNQDVVLTYSKLAFCNDELIENGVMEEVKKVDSNDKYFFNNPIRIAHFVSFLKEAYDKTSGINSELTKAVDQDLYLKVYEQGEVKFINKVLYKYRIHQGGISQNSQKNKAKDSFSKVLFETLKRRGFTEINNQKVPEKYTNPNHIFNLIKEKKSIFSKVIQRLKF